MPSAVSWRNATASSWSAQFDEARACQRLDDELEKLVWNLRRHASSLEKTLRSRVLRWCAKFESEKDSPALVWKKGRNQHARALLAGLRGGRLPAPFDAGPPAGPLGAGVSVACAVAVGLESTKTAATRAAAAGEGEQRTAKRRPPPPPLVPGTAALRLAPPQLRFGEEAGEPPSSSSSSSFSQVHLPSRVELAASLGAATEKIAELEWRLGEKERRSRAREWEASVAVARASAALLSSFEGEPPREEEERRARRRKPFSTVVAAASQPLPALPPSPVKKAATAEAPQPLPLRRPKARGGVAAAAPTPLIPSVSLEELSRRISALAPQY